ncbi:MAG: hypothetical protein M5R36_20200 [Deltaproteobacteria bacterium]|nr:hypothetical protein [Deltaproteobacteria bacterium]
MKKIFAALILMFLIVAVGASADELSDRAQAFDDWLNTYHVTPYGGIGYVNFVSPESDEITSYSLSDSTIWTGTYLAAEAFRYAVTGDAEAKENAVRTVEALDAHLQVTGVPGFIARFAGPDIAPHNTAYIGHDRYVAGTGDWAGSFWINNTSRDQYTGWFLGMSLAYDLVDDEPMRDIIRADVKDVIDKLMADNYWIRGEDGRPTDAGPHALSTMRVCWHLIAAHILDDPEYWDLYEERYEADRGQFDIHSFSLFQKYDQYYGFNLAHDTFFNLLRLERNPDRRAFYLRVFHDQIRWLVEYTHNVLFDVIYLANCDRAGECRGYDASLRDLQEQIADFQDPPVRDVTVEIPEIPLDPFSVFLSDLIDQLGLRDLIDIEPQSLYPRPVRHRCPSSFMWQKTPYNIDCAGGDGHEVYPGVDYLTAYWMGRYYNLIEPGQTGEVLWPPDEASDDDADDDIEDDDSDDEEPDDDDDDVGPDGDDDDSTGDISSGDDDDDDGCGC